MSAQINNANACKFCFEGDAKRVFLAGDFNDWNPTSIRMSKKNGSFRKNLNLSPGRHEYKFVVDGRWQSDPDVIDWALDGHGGINSVLTV